MEESLEVWIIKLSEDILNLTVLFSQQEEQEQEQQEDMKKKNLKECIFQLFYYVTNTNTTTNSNNNNQIRSLKEIKDYFFNLFKYDESSFNDYPPNSNNSNNNNDENIYFIIKLLLKYVVSLKCQQRETFVSHIISLDPIVQEYLMEAIQSIPEDQSSSIENDQENYDYEFEQDEQVLNQEDIVLQQSHQSHLQPVHHSKVSNKGYSCDDCRLYKFELEKYRKEIATFVEHEKVREEQYQVENSTQMHKIMDLESLVTQRNIEIRELKNELEIVQKKDIEQTNKLKEKYLLESKIYELQEQVDSLIQMSKRAETAEKQVEKMKDKLDKLDRVNELLKAETEAHNETHSTLLQMEQELTTLRSVKQHLEEYRKRCVENEIVIKDLQLQLSKYESINHELQVELKNKIQGNELTINQTKLLTKELLDASATLRDQERGTGVGTGISEFNPEIKKELQFLRAENEELKQQINDSSLESLDRLRQEISDQQCFNNSLQIKWNNSKDTIKLLEKNVYDLKSQLDISQQNYKVLKLESLECSEFYAEDLLSHKFKYDQNKQFLQKTFEHNLNLLTLGKDSIIKQLELELSSTRNELEILTSNHEELNKNYQYSQERIELLEQNLEELNQKYKLLEKTSEEKLKISHEEHKQSYQKLSNEHEENIENLKENYLEKLSFEKKRYETLEVELEFERNKRRKIEREKKLYENETIKYRNQYEMLANSQSNNEGNKHNENIIKELKVTQDQLDLSRNEVKRLQDQIYFMESTSKSNVLSTRNLTNRNNNTAGNNILQDNMTNISNEDDSVDVQSTGMMSSGPSRTRINGNNMNINMSNQSNMLLFNQTHTTDLSAYIEQTELLERKIDQMNREKRELIAKNHEESKEKTELNQRLLQHEQEYATLKAKFVKLELEKERLERRLAKNETENIAPTGPITRSRKNVI